MSNVVKAVKTLFSGSSEQSMSAEEKNNSEMSTRESSRKIEENDDSTPAEIRYNGLPLDDMRLYEIKAALEKLGVAFKKTEKKSVLEALLRETLKHHDHSSFGHGRRGRSTPAPASASKTRLALRGKSSPPGTNHNLRSAGYSLRSRDDSHTRSAHASHATVSHLAEVSAGHIKANAATAPSKAEPYEENGFLFYSTKGGMRSPSVSSRRSRARSERSTRSSRNAVGSDSEEDGYDGQDTVVKVRKAKASETPMPEPKKAKATPKPTPKSVQSKGRANAKKATTAVVTQEEASNESDVESTSDNESEKEEDRVEEQTNQQVSEEHETNQEELNDSHADFFDANDGESQNGQDDRGDMVFEGPATREEAGADMDIVDEEYSEPSDSDDAGSGDEEEGSGEESGEEEGYDVREDDGSEDEDGTIPSEVDEENGFEIDIEGGSSADEADVNVLADEDEHTAGSDEGSYDEEGESQDGESDEESEEMVVVEVGSSDEGSQDEGSAEEEGSEGSDEDGSDINSDDVDSESEEDEDEEEWPFTEPGASEVVDLLDSSSDEDEEYKAPVFAFTTPAPTTTAAPTSFAFKLPVTTAAAPATTKFEFKLPAGAVTIAPPAPVVFKYPATLSDPSKSKITFDTLPGAASAAKNPFAFTPAAAPAIAAAPPAMPKAPFVFGQNNGNEPAKFTFTAPAPVLPAAPVVAAPAPATTEPAAEMSPAVAAFTKLSQNVMAVFANNLTSAKKEKLSVEEYALLKSLLESSRPPEVEATPAKPSVKPVAVASSPVPAPVVVPATVATAEKVKSPVAALDTTLPSAEKSQDKENVAVKSISFGTKDTHIPRTSYDGGAWNSRESFLPSPPATPAVHFAEPAAPSERLSGQLFADVQAGRLAHRLPTPYHSKRNAFSAGWTGGSEPGSVSFDEDALASLPPSKRQSLEGGYRSIQYRQQTPGAAYVNQGRLSVGSGMLSDTPDPSWSAGSNLRTGSARNSVSGYSGMAPPSFNLNQAGGFAVGRASYTPGFRNNATRFTPSAAAVEGPQSENRVSRLPVSTSSRASLGGAPTSNLSSTLSYVQRRKLQLKAENGQSAAVAKKILETLNGLSTPMEEQRAKPVAISWDKDVKSPAESRHAPATPHPAAAPTRSGFQVSFKDNTSPVATPVAAPVKTAVPEIKVTAPASTAKMDSPFVHSSIRQKPEPTPTFKVTPQAPAVVLASDEEFTFEEPMEVSGVEDQIKETRDPATGTLKRSLLNAAATDDYSVKYAFSPPGKAPKVEIPVSVAKAPAAAAPAAVVAKAAPAEKAAPAAAALPASSGTGIWALSAINDGVKCGVCMSKNSKGATKCASCESPIGGDAKSAPAAAPASIPSSAASAPPASSGTGIWALSAINDGIKCGVCMSKNSKGATKCASCESPIGSAAAAEKPAAVASSGFGAPATTTTAPGAISKSGFTFGASAATASTPASAPSAIKDNGFTFGAPPAAPVASATSASDSTATKAGFSFPTFGTTPASSGAEAAKDATVGFAPAATKPAVPATSGFTFPSAPAVVEAQPASKVTFSGFGAAPATTTPAALPSFGVTPAEPATTTPAPISFGTSMPSFGAPSSFSTGKRGADGDAQDVKDTSDEQPSRKRKDDSVPAFATSTPSFGAFPALPTTFGAAPGDKPKDAPAAAGGITFPPASSNPFGAITSKPEEKKVESGGASDKPFTFGATPAPAASTNSGFTFGASAASAPSTADKVLTPFTFGATPAPAATTTTAANPEPFKFGGVPDASSKPAATPLPALPAFGTTAPAFGGAVTTPSNSFDAKPAGVVPAPLGAFGATPAATSGTEPKPFTFGATPAPKAATDAPFLFGAAGSAKPPLASSNPLSSPTLGFPGVAAVDTRLGANAAGAITPLPTFGATSASSVGTDSPGSTMDTGSFSNHSAPSTAPAFGGAAVSGNPFSSSFGAPAAAPSADAKQPFTFGSNSAAPAPSTSFAFGATANTNSNASAAPAFGGFAPAASPFGGAPAAAGPFGAPAAAAPGPFGGSSGAMGAFGSTPSLGGLSSSASNSNLFGAAPSNVPAQGGLGGAFGSNNNLAAAGGFGGGAFGSSNNLPSLGGNMGMGGFGASNTNNNSMGGGLGSFGQQASQNSLSQAGAGGGGFSLGAADKKTTEVRRKVKVPPRK